MRRLWYVCACVALLLAPCVSAFGAGAPPNKCGQTADMVPNHSALPAQASDVPYILSSNSGDTTYTPEQIFSLTVGGGTFKGFLIQAKDQSGSLAGFFTASDACAQVLSCGGVGNSGITHTNSSGKTTCVFQWEAPPSDVGNITFYVTFVMDYSTFWVQTEPLVITPEASGVSPEATTMNTDSPTVAVTNAPLPQSTFVSSTTDASLTLSPVQVTRLSLVPSPSPATISQSAATPTIARGPGPTGDTTSSSPISSSTFGTTQSQQGDGLASSLTKDNTSINSLSNTGDVSNDFPSFLSENPDFSGEFGGLFDRKSDKQIQEILNPNVNGFVNERTGVIHKDNTVLGGKISDFERTYHTPSDINVDGFVSSSDAFDGFKNNETPNNEFTSQTDAKNDGFVNEIPHSIPNTLDTSVAKAVITKDKSSTEQADAGSQGNGFTNEIAHGLPKSEADSKSIGFIPSALSTKVVTTPVYTSSADGFVASPINIASGSLTASDRVVDGFQLQRANQPATGAGSIADGFVDTDRDSMTQSAPSDGFVNNMTDKKQDQMSSLESIIKGTDSKITDGFVSNNNEVFTTHAPFIESPITRVPNMSASHKGGGLKDVISASDDGFLPVFQTKKPEIRQDKHGDVANDIINHLMNTHENVNKETKEAFDISFNDLSKSGPTGPTDNAVNPFSVIGDGFQQVTPGIQQTETIPTRPTSSMITNQVNKIPKSPKVHDLYDGFVSDSQDPDFADSKKLNKQNIFSEAGKTSAPSGNTFSGLIHTSPKRTFMSTNPPRMLHPVNNRPNIRPINNFGITHNRSAFPKIPSRINNHLDVSNNALFRSNTNPGSITTNVRGHHHNGGFDQHVPAQQPNFIRNTIPVPVNRQHAPNHFQRSINRVPIRMMPKQQVQSVLPTRHIQPFHQIRRNMNSIGHPAHQVQFLNRVQGTGIQQAQTLPSRPITGVQKMPAKTSVVTRVKYPVSRAPVVVITHTPSYPVKPALANMSDTLTQGSGLAKSEDKYPFKGLSTGLPKVTFKSKNGVTNPKTTLRPSVSTNSTGLMGKWRSQVLGMIKSLNDNKTINKTNASQKSKVTLATTEVTVRSSSHEFQSKDASKHANIDTSTRAVGPVHIGHDHHHHHSTDTNELDHETKVSRLGDMSALVKGGVIMYDSECGSSKGCFVDCAGQDCNFMVTWRDRGATVQFELYGKPDPSFRDAWIAVAFSGDSRMGDDSVTECVYSGGQVQAFNSYNQGYSNRRLNPSQVGLGNIYGHYIDGVLYCTFERQKSMNIQQEMFDLESDWNIMFANGRAMQVPAWRISMHSTTDLPPTSASKVDYQSFVVIGSGASFPAVKAHGILMIIAWVLFVGIGIVAARYYKGVWADKTFMKLKIWFQVHRGCMVTALVLNVISFVVIFVEVGGYSQIPDIPGKTYLRSHPVLGIIVTILCLANPIMALFRPGPDHQHRPLFNWAHWGVGMAAYILSAITICFGFQLGKSSTPDYAVYIMIVYVLYVIIFDVVFEVMECMNKKEKTAKVENIEMANRNGSTDNGSVPNGNFHAKDKVKKTDKLKTLLLAIHIAFTGAFALVLTLVVALN